MSTHPHTTKPAPPGWPRISPALFYDDAAAAIDWLCTAFGFEVILKIEGEGGRIEHSELDYGEGMIMVGDTRVRARRENGVPARSPQSLPDRANTQSLCIAVDDVDAHCAHAKKSGAKIIAEPKVAIVVVSRSIDVTVLGEVSRQGKYKLKAGDGVPNALALAGGVTEFGNENAVYLVRSNEPLRIRFRMKDLLQGGNSATAFALRDGDLIVVE